NGGNCGTSSIQTFNHKLLSLPTATRTGYIFDGWYTSANGGSKITTSTSFAKNTTVYAHWASDEYTIIFNANGGSCSVSSKQTSNHKLSNLPTAAKANFTFDGWYTAVSGGTKISTATVFSYNTTVYAHWSEINGDVKFFSKTVSGGTKSTNIQKNGYNGTYHASPMRSYLYESNGYLNRLEYTGADVILEKYSSSFSLLGKTTIKMELPIFGGFYAGTDYNFILFGQNNPNEKNSIEIMRVVKYTKDMKRVDSKSFYGCNTYIPFDAGCPRMDEYDGVLYIHTSHEMYKSSDGHNHQSNMDFFIRISDMETLYSRYNVTYTKTGYMSHSFNQFIKVNENGIYTVDHGDAYNRAVTAFRRKSATDSNAEYEDVFKIMGSIGQNYTGVCIGGMELSDDNMLIAGTSVPQDSTWNKTKQKNLFIIRKSLSGNESAEVTYLTNYSEGSNVTFSEPKLVKINGNKFMLLWSETVSSQTKLYAVLLDGNGKKMGKTFSCAGSISDCQPIVYNGKVTFYVTNNSAPTFYYSS
ncbi:MAG: InlB B-repeat-containing protein, partial [Muribaculaceae bacterium]|nr:InlB B-repeat-containing protein [Muribaculaceae bacterium]